jgi:heptosyltransferase-2/heptosyltransferase-3
VKILVIKQTSLGDVLHSTGHVRAIKQTWPECELVLLTATGSADIYRHNPWVDRMILVDRYRVKHNWFREPVWCIRHMNDVMSQVRSDWYDFAFDLQGLAKSAVFLYGARAKQKFIKGAWPGIKGYRRSNLHAIREMDGVLRLAGIENIDTSMEFATSEHEVEKIDNLLDKFNPAGKPFIIFSPFSRWPSKDWPLDFFLQVAKRIANDRLVLFTGAPERAALIEQALMRSPESSIISLAGKLSLLEFAELVRRAALMLTGDSFPMHVAVACKTEVVALFGPTDEARVGPPEGLGYVVRAPDCRKCDRRDCSRHCLAKITVESIEQKIQEILVDR